MIGVEAGDRGEPGDGRTRRGERTRERIVDAVLELLDGGELRPGAEAIAARAGVSPRTVFGHFPEREALIAAVAVRQEARVRALVEPIPADAPLVERLDAFVSGRARVLEAVSGVRRAALLMEPFAPQVAERLGQARRAGAAQVDAVFAPELADLPEDERKVVREALVLAAAWPAWEGLRRHQGLPPAAARAAMRRTLAALLGS
jgi:TetR/AcrR family transcriptional regulator, regulator of autoinduction and epiphytic fitness